MPYPDALRGIGINFVIAIHAFAYLHLPIDGGWSIPWFIAYQIAVPIFFLASGWVYGMHRGVPPAGLSFRARILHDCRRLMLPWALFSILYLVERVLAERLGIVGGKPVLADGIRDIPTALWFGASAGQLYFLPALMLVQILSSFLYPLIRDRPAGAALLAALLIALWRLRLEPMFPEPAAGVDPIVAAIAGLGYTAAGWALAEAEVAGVAIHGTLIPIVGLLILGFMLGHGLGDDAFQMAYLLAAWWLVRVTSRHRMHAWLAKLGRHTMGIYLLHGPIVVKLVSDLLLRTHLPPALDLCMDVALVLGISLGAAMVVERFAPIAFGGRLGRARRAR